MVSTAMGAAMNGTMYFLRANCAQHGGSAGGGLIRASLLSYRALLLRMLTWPGTGMGVESRRSAADSITFCAECPKPLPWGRPIPYLYRFYPAKPCNKMVRHHASFPMWFMRNLRGLLFVPGSGLAAVSRQSRWTAWMRNRSGEATALHSAYTKPVAGRESHRERCVNCDVTLASHQSALLWFHASHESANSVGISCQLSPYEAGPGSNLWRKQKCMEFDRPISMDWEEAIMDLLVRSTS